MNNKIFPSESMRSRSGIYTEEMHMILKKKDVILDDVLHPKQKRPERRSSSVPHLLAHGEVGRPPS